MRECVNVCFSELIWDQTARTGHIGSTILNSIREVPVSILGGNTDYPEVIRDILQSPNLNVWRERQISLRLLPPASHPFQNSLGILPFDATAV